MNTGTTPLPKGNTTHGTTALEIDGAVGVSEKK